MLATIPRSSSCCEQRERLQLPLKWCVLALVFAFVPVVSSKGQSASAQSLADELEANQNNSAAEDAETSKLLGKLEAEELTPQQQAAAAFAAPPEAKRISKDSNIWIDPEAKRVYVDGYVTLRQGPLEMFACPVGTKEHEAIVASLAKSREVHAGLLAVGAEPGTPAMWDPKFVPPTGQRIRVWVLWRDENGQFQAKDAREWVRNTETGKALRADWVFGGSSVWEDPADGQKYYQADGGDMICVSNFSTAMMDVPFASSAQAGNLQFVPFTERIPERWMPVRLVLVPIPNPTDEPQKETTSVNVENPPSEKVLPPGRKPASGETTSPEEALDKLPEDAETKKDDSAKENSANQPASTSADDSGSD